ncbi:MAG: hypothetical protein AAGH67_00750 [Cyanobacteria bacterium P01_H01_bin.162]
MAVDIVRQWEAEGQFPQADYAFDCGVLFRPLTELIAASGKHWVSEIESSRLILWQGQWQRVDGIAQAWRQEHPESFRANVVTGRNGQQRNIWAFTQTVRWKKYGSKRLVVVHETADLSDTPRFLLTDALHWDSSRTLTPGVIAGRFRPFMSLSSKLSAFSRRETLARTRRLSYARRKRLSVTSV